MKQYAKAHDQQAQSSRFYSIRWYVQFSRKVSAVSSITCMVAGMAGSEKKGLGPNFNATVPATLVHEPAAIQETPISAPSVVPAATPLKASPPLTPLGILTPPPTMEMSPPSKRKRKRPRFQFRNYLGDDAHKRRSRRVHRHQPYKYSKDKSD